MDKRLEERMDGRLPLGRFEGREAFQQRVRDAFLAAAREGWREIVVSDADFWDWPLGERAVAEALQAWAGAGRRFTMLACSYDEVVRRHPRFVHWRRTWDHLITCRRSPQADPLALPSALWSPDWFLQRIDAERCRGLTGDAPRARVQLRETLDEWLRARSSPGFPATTLGL